MKVWDGGAEQPYGIGVTRWRDYAPGLLSSRRGQNQIVVIERRAYRQTISGSLVDPCRDFGGDDARKIAVIAMIFSRESDRILDSWSSSVEAS